MNVRTQVIQVHWALIHGQAASSLALQIKQSWKACCAASILSEEENVCVPVWVDLSQDR